MSDLIELERRIADRIREFSMWFSGYPEVSIVLNSLTTNDGLMTANLNQQQIREACDVISKTKKISEQAEEKRKAKLLIDLIAKTKVTDSSFAPDLYYSDVEDYIYEVFDLWENDASE